MADKHDKKHWCYNAKFHLDISDGSEMNTGLLDDELDAFQGVAMADQELTILVR